MKEPRFQEQDRTRVVRAIEENWEIRLKKVRGYRKWLQDASGKSWWVLGGKDWHGIPEKMMEAELENPTNGMLVVAYTGPAPTTVDFEVFAGPVEPLVTARNNLSLGKVGRGYQHHFVCVIKEMGTRMQITGKASAYIATLKRCDLLSGRTAL